MKYFAGNVALIRQQLEYFGFWTWANTITTCRIILISISAAFILSGLQPTLAFLLLLTATLTDKLDGEIARRYNHKTIIGDLFDKLADKYLVVVKLLIATLIIIGTLEPKFGPGMPNVSLEWLIYLLLAELFLFVIGLASLAFPILPTSAGYVGKIKMTCECVFILFCYFSYLRPFGFGFDDMAIATQRANFLLKLSFWLAIGSALQYAIRGLKNYRFMEGLRGEFK